MILIIEYNGIQKQTEFLIDSFKKETVYFKGLHQADNSASLSIPYNMEIQNFINAYADNDIKAIIQDEGKNIFYGYLRKNFSFSKKQRNQPINIEIVSPSFLLDVNIQKRVIKDNSTLNDILTVLLSGLGIKINKNSQTLLTKKINLFIADLEENLKDVIDGLLFEHGFCYDFNESGEFIAYPIYDIPDNLPESIEQEFNGSNCLNEIKISKKEQKEDSVIINWNSLDNYDGLIFADLTGSNDSEKCKIELKPKTYLGENENYFINYDSSNGEVVYVKTAALKIESNNNSGLKTSFENLGNKGKLSIYNNTDKVITITRINVNGNYYAVSGINKTKTVGTKTKSIDAIYINNKEDAKYLSENYANYLNYSDYKINLKSKTNYNLGSFVKVTENGLGSIYGRIIEKKINLKTKAVDYIIEGVKEYQAATSENIEYKHYTAFNTIIGPAGKDGAIGPQGPKGDKGNTGATGPAGAKGDKGETGATGKDGAKGKDGATGIAGTFTSKAIYSPSSCLDYCTRNANVSWSDSEIEQPKGNAWTAGNRIILVINCTDGNVYTSYQIVTSRNALKPEKTYWINKKGNTGSQGPKGDKGDPGKNGINGTNGASYKGASATAPANPNYNDFYLNTTDGYIRYYNTSNQWAKITDYTDYRYHYAMPDMVDIAGKQGVNQNVQTAVNSWCKNLMAQKAMIDELTANEGFINTLAANDAFLNSIKTKKIRLLDNGAIIGGNRYNDDGTIKDFSKNGFYQSADGVARMRLIGDRNNVCIGEGAGNRIYTGGTQEVASSNICMGYYAGANISTGGSNTCIGSRAGEQITSGFDNIFIGKNAGGVLTTGRDNVCIGEQAGHDLSGDFNTFIGCGAGYNVTTGNYNISIGYREYWEESSGNHQLRIGDHIECNGDGEPLFIKNLEGEIPVGTIISVISSDTIFDQDWLECDGSAISRAKYSRLFRYTGTKFGAGDGSTTFNLPDLRGKYLMGAGQNKDTGENWREGDFREAGLPNIEGYFYDPTYENSTIGGIVVDNKLFGIRTYQAYKREGYKYGNQKDSNKIVFNARGYNSIYGNSKTVTPSSIAVRWLIRY